jgi:hypothetical protein
MSGKAGKRAKQQIVDAPRPAEPAAAPPAPDAAGEAEPKGMPTSDRMGVETAHHHPAHGGGARNDGQPVEKPKR